MVFGNIFGSKHYARDFKNAVEKKDGHELTKVYKKWVKHYTKTGIEDTNLHLATLMIDVLDEDITASKLMQRLESAANSEPIEKDVVEWYKEQAIFTIVRITTHKGIEMDLDKVRELLDKI